VPDLGVPKVELQPLALRRLLMDLFALQLIYQTIDDKFYLQRSVSNPRFERFLVEDRAKYIILDTLTRDGGKYNVLELGQIITDKLRINNEEYNVLVSQLLASNVVIVGENGKLYSQISAPRAKAK
jgi:hypothetical protein